MNEQIEQLVKQFAEDLMKRSGYDMRAFEPFLVESRQFAEKIVQEVLGRIQIHQQMDEATEEWVYTSLNVDIKEHFGVE